MSFKLLESIMENPIPYAHALGYTKLTEEIHGPWIKRILRMAEDGTLQAHRGAYKTTCLIVALNLWAISRPTENIIFIRKSAEDVKDVIGAVSKSLQSDISMHLMKGIYGRFPKLSVDSKTELELDVFKGCMGRQILGLGLKSSITGKHGSVVTDDIITVKDRLSTAEREATKSQFMEMINIASEENMNIFNTGTPWHKDDAFSLMPKAEVHTVYDTGILSKEEINKRRGLMTPSLFAANYELKHIADGNVLFGEPKFGEFPIGTKCYGHIDASYGGEDGTAITIIAERGDALHVIGWLKHGHVEDYYNEIVSKFQRYQVALFACENNADKGFLRKELTKLTTANCYSYHEKMNKYYKITTFGKVAWKRVIFDLDNSDPEYLSQIMDYSENAGHDDAPDSYASLIRWKFHSRVAKVDSSVGRAF